MTKFLTLDEYTKIAIVYLKKYVPRLCSDNDAIGYVVHDLIKSDIKFNGKGKLEKYRGANAKYACLDLVLGKPKIFRKKHYNLENIDQSSLLCYNDYQLENAIKKELEESLDKVKYGSFLKKRFYNNMSLQQIGDEVGLTRERVRQIINEGLQDLKRIINA